MSIKSSSLYFKTESFQASIRNEAWESSFKSKLLVCHTNWKRPATYMHHLVKVSMTTKTSAPLHLTKIAACTTSVSAFMNRDTPPSRNLSDIFTCLLETSNNTLSKILVGACILDEYDILRKDLEVEKNINRYMEPSEILWKGSEDVVMVLSLWHNHYLS